MKCIKILTMATIAVAATFSLGVQAEEGINYNAKIKSLQNSNNPNKIITDTLFSNASSQEKERLQEQIQKYSKIQYGFGTASANPSPVKDADVMNNIKSHNPATVKSQMIIMREAAQELPHLQQISNKRNP